MPRGQTAVTVVFLILVAGALSLYETAARPLFTAHEARAARCARHMLRSDRWPADKPSPWLVPQFSPDASPDLAYQKPPLYYWAVAAASAVGGEVTRLTVRLPSAAGFVLMVVVVYFLGRDLVSHRTGLVAALVLVSTPKMLWWGRAAILDPMLAACIAGSLLFFVRAHLTGAAAGGSRFASLSPGGRGRGEGDRRVHSRRAPSPRPSPVKGEGDSGAWQYYLFWALAGLGTLVKATALVVPLLTVGLYLLARWRAEGLWRPLRRLKPITGPLVLLAVAAPWHVAAHVATDGAFSRVYWGIHVFGRATGTSVFEDTTAPWYYLPAMARDLFPWVVFLPGALVQVWRRPSRPYRGRMLFPFVWLVGSLAFFSAVSFRKDEYMLVAYPAAALLIGYFLDYYVEAQGADARLHKWVVAAFAVVAGCAVLVSLGMIALASSPDLRDRLYGSADLVTGADGRLSGRGSKPPDISHLGARAEHGPPEEQPLLTNDTDRAVWRGVAERFASRPWLAAALFGPLAVGSVAAAVLVLRRRAGGAMALTVCTTLLAFVLFVETIVPVLGRVRGLADFADKVEAEAVRRGEGARVLLAVAECHELAFILDERAEGLRAHPEPAAFLVRQVAQGRSWLLVMDLDAWLCDEFGPLPGWVVVAATPEGHRRPMVCVAPPTGEGAV